MTRERYIDQWPKPMFLCTYCDEQTDSDPCQECASVFDERGENYPPVLRFQVVPAPAQPEQPREEEARVEKCRCGFPFYEDRFTIPRLDGGSVPDAWEFCPYCGGRLDEPAQPQPRGEGDAGKTRGYTREDIQANTWWPGKGGEGDDLAARLEDAATTAQRIGAKHREEGNSAASSYYRGQRNAYNEAAELARASCHPEQRGGSIRGCSPSSTRTPPTNAGRRGLAGSTDTNAPRGSCSNEPMPR